MKRFSYTVKILGLICISLFVSTFMVMGSAHSAEPFTIIKFHSEIQNFDNISQREVVTPVGGQAKGEVPTVGKQVTLRMTNDEILARAKQFWINQLGFNPFSNWTPPVNWNAGLGNNSGGTELGSTYALVPVTPGPLSNQYGLAYVDMDMNKIYSMGYDPVKTLTHELGHALGLNHGPGIMSVMDEASTYTLTPSQKQYITTSYNLGH